MKISGFKILLIGALLVFSLSAVARQFPLSPTINACDNFYQHVCAEEISGFEMPPHRSRYTFFFSDAFENFVETQTRFLNEIEKTKKPSPWLKQILHFSASCNNESTRKTEELAIVQETVSKISEIKTRIELLKFVKEQVQSGRSFLFELNNGRHTSDPQIYRAYVQVNLSTLPEKLLYKKDDVTKGLKDLVQLLLSREKIVDPELNAKLIVALEKKYSESMLTTEERQSRWDLAEYWTRDEFINKFPLISNILNIQELKSDVQIHQYMPTTYEMTEKILQNEDVDTLKYFMLFVLLNEDLDSSDPDYKLARIKFFHEYAGEPAQARLRKEECVVKTQNMMGRPLAREMTQKVFDSFPRKKFVSMVEKIRSTLVQRIQNNTWLSAEGKKNAVKKVKALDLALLYPHRDKDWRFPPLVDLNGTDYLKNIWKLNKAYYSRTRNELNGPVNAGQWSVTPLHFDASFYRAENRFYFPAAFTMKPIFDPARTEIENIGGIGFVVAHELGHSLDKLGSQYNERGEKKSILSGDDQKKFDSFGEVLQKQFNAIGHDGIQTLAENVADHVGLVTSYESAFPKNAKVKLENKKKFFYAFARSWCTAMTSSYKETFLKSDTHALPVARVNEQLKHWPAFAETFQCSRESKMVLPAENRINIW